LPLIEPLPINVGVYYGNDFRAYKKKQLNVYSQNVTSICNIQLGEANIALFDYILFNVFDNVTSIQQLPNKRHNFNNIDLIIEPTISDYAYALAERSDPEASAYITYEIRFYSPDDMQITSWTIHGEGFIPPRFQRKGPVLSRTWVVKLTQLAMREVAAQFMTDFCNQKDIQTLFHEQCNQ